MGRRRREVKSNDGDSSSKTKRKRTTPEAEEAGDMAEPLRPSLSEVVLECTQRWFQDTLKEAKAGDVNMQVLVGQMYYSGYGGLQDAQKGKFWITRASRVRSSVWKVSHKRPGYNASDSDSDEVEGDS